MRHIGSIIGGARAEPAPQIPENALPRAWIDLLFARFARIWPDRWPLRLQSVDVDEYAREWQIGLAGMSGEDIRDAIVHIRAHFPWPPSIAEFRDLGMTAEQAAFRARERAISEECRLEPPDDVKARRKAAGRIALAEMRALLRMPPRSDRAAQ